ncbi:MAG: hypothetical protein COC10_10095 [Sphingobium sp.]|nr:MAG: hypothetical protein COC10_10095 [Sphingobium sp.]
MSDRPQPDDDTRVPLERLVTLSNAVFAVAIILPVLGIGTPRLPADASRLDNLMALHQLTPGFIVFGVNFLVLSLFWLGQHRLLRRVRRYDSALVLPVILLLLMIAFMPWATKFAVVNDNHFIAALSYNVSMLACAFHLLWLAWVCRQRQLTPDAPLELRRAIVTFAATLLCVALSFFTPQFSQSGMALTLIGRRAPAKAKS